jgi:sugar lactone lactonase YvrE
MKQFIYSLLLLVPAFAHAQIISTIAGGAATGFILSGPALSVSFNEPFDVCTDAHGNVYIADGDNHVIRKVDTAGMLTTIAGNGTGAGTSTGGYGGDGGPATAAELNRPHSVAIDQAGNLYIADYLNSRVRKVDTAGIITTFAGNGSSGSLGDGGPATAAELAAPIGVAVDGMGNVYISDWDASKIRMVNTAGIITTVAGGGSSLANGVPATTAQLDGVIGIAVDAAGNLYYADAVNDLVRKVTVATGIVNTIAGTGVTGASGDGGLADTATINYPTGVAVDATGRVYFSDLYNYKIRRIDNAGIITTIAGTGLYGFSGDGGPAIAAQLDITMEMSFDAAGSLYVADNGRARKITFPSAGTIIGGLSICRGDTTALTDTVTGGVWSSGNTGVATVGSGTGMVIGAAAGVAVITYAAGTCYVTKTVTVNPVPSAIMGEFVGGGGVRLCGGEVTTLTDSAAGGTWSSSNTGDATIGSSTGILTCLSPTGAAVDTITYTLPGGCSISVPTVWCEGVPQVSASNELVTLFPNPATTQLTITASSAINEINISNLLGQTVYNSQFTVSGQLPTANSRLQTIDVSALPSGVYFVRVNPSAGSGQAVVRKFVKE